MNLHGNTVFITGGGSGIGRGLAEAFHKLGNKVIIGGRRRDVLEQTIAANPGMHGIVLDTRDAESIKSAATDVVRDFPELNVVINNAGVQRVFNFAADAPEAEAFADEVDTNINGVLRVTTAFLPQLKSRPSATLINVSSGLAFIPLVRYPVYCATKAFVHSFTMSLRQQLKNTSVRVLELAPPWVATDLGAGHTDATAHSGMSPMPLADFIAATMQELGTDEQELKIAGAKFLYGAGVGEQAQTVFARMNS
jgi:uncharacterized oxidoreductase